MKPENMQKRLIKSNVLYITYDGIMEPLGQSQVLQYLIKLAKYHNMLLISYEKSADWEDKNRWNIMLEDTRSVGIHWVPLRYHKRPSAVATAYDIAMGFCVSAFLVLRHRIQVVHARSYVPSVMALALKKLTGIKFLFDMRGFWALCKGLKSLSRNTRNIDTGQFARDAKNNLPQKLLIKP